MKSSVFLFMILIGFACACDNHKKLPPPAQHRPPVYASPSDSLQAVKPSLGEPISIPADADAQYTITERGGTPDKPTITTKRVTMSGTTYARREFDCQHRMFRYLGEGDSMADVDASTPDAKMGPVADGSIEDYLGRAACAGKAKP